MKKLLLLTIAISMFNCSKDDDTVSITKEQAMENIAVVVNYVEPDLDPTYTVETEFSVTATNNNQYSVEGWISFKFVAITSDGREVLEAKNYLHLGCASLAPNQSCTISSSVIVGASATMEDVEITDQFFKVITVN